MIDRAVIGIIAIVIAFLIVIAAFTFSGSKPATSTTITNNYSVSLPTTSIQQYVPASPANATVAQQFINQSEARSLLGTGGAYGAYARTTPAQLSYVISPQLSQYNITAVYNMSYLTNSTNGANVLRETIYKSSQTKILYLLALSQSQGYLNKTLLYKGGARNITISLNATSGALTYFSSSFIVPPNTMAGSNTLLGLQMVFGYTNKSVVAIQMAQLNSTPKINSTALAALVAKNIQ